MKKKGFVFTIDSIAAIGAVIILMGAYLFFTQSAQGGLTAKSTVDADTFDASMVGFYLDKEASEFSPLTDSPSAFSANKFGYCSFRIDYPLNTNTSQSAFSFIKYCGGSG
ncbi:MAG: hypothetical protein V1494_02535 [Candidatus Diapherotrites archaeon]